MKPKFKIEHPDAPEDPYISTGYVRLPDAAEVKRKREREKRADEPSPLLKEFMEREAKKREQEKGSVG